MSNTKQIIPGSGWNAPEWLGVITVTIGAALLTFGITLWVKEGFQQGLYYLVGGVLAIVLPFAITISAMNKSKIKYEYPTAEKRHLTTGENVQVVLFTLAFACLIIGFGVALSSALIMLKYGWDFAKDFLYFGLIGAGAPFLLFVVLGSIFIK